MGSRAMYQLADSQPAVVPRSPVGLNWLARSMWPAGVNVMAWQLMAVLSGTEAMSQKAPDSSEEARVVKERSGGSGISEAVRPGRMAMAAPGAGRPSLVWSS